MREHQRKEIPKISDYIVSLQVYYLSHCDSKIAHAVPQNCDDRWTR